MTDVSLILSVFAPQIITLLAVLILLPFILHKSFNSKHKP